MSLHRSLQSDARLTRQRNVMTRWERILRLKEEERWSEGRSAFCLPKVKVVHHKRHKKAKKEAEEGAEGAEGAAAAEAAPAAGAKAPAGKSAPAEKSKGAKK